MIRHSAVSLIGKEAPYEIWLNAPVGVMRPDDAMELARALVQAATLAEWGGPGLGIEGPPQAAARPVPDARYCRSCGRRRRVSFETCDDLGSCVCGYNDWVSLDTIIYEAFRSLKELWRFAPRRSSDPDPIKVYR